DSIFSFTDLPIKVLLTLGAVGTAFAIVAGVIMLVFWSLGRLRGVGYTPLMLAIVFLGGLTALGLGIVGQYLWQMQQHARNRPSFIVMSARSFGPSRARESRDNVSPLR